MSDRQPRPPETLSKTEVGYLKQFSTEQLRDVERYTRALVEHREQEKEEHDKNERGGSAQHSEDRVTIETDTGVESRTQSVPQTATDLEHDGTTSPEQSAAAATSNEDTADELPDDVPAKATTTIKEINGNRYYYWQWRDGEKIRSKYKGPVNSDT